MKFALFPLAATAVLAAPSLEQFPQHLQASSICSVSPYKQWLPLSKLAAAETYCAKEFPVATPVCTTKIVTPGAATKKTTLTETSTIVEATIKTVTTGSATTTTTSTTFFAINTVTVTNYASNVIVTGCSLNNSSTTGTVYGTYMTKSVSTTTKSSSATRAADTIPARRWLARDSVLQKRATSTKTSAKKTSSRKFSTKKTTLAQKPTPQKQKSTTRHSTVQLTSGKQHSTTKHDTTTAPAKATLQAQLRSLEALGNVAKAKTICGCINFNPACTTKTVTGVRKTSINTIWTTVTSIARPLRTTSVPNTATVTNKVTITDTSRTTTTTTTITPTQLSCSGIATPTS